MELAHLSRIIHRTLTVLTCVLALAGCGHGEKESRTNDLAFDRNAKNVLLNFGAPTNLTGVPVDIQKNDQLFREGGFGFEVVSVNKATKAQILDNTRRHAAAVSDTGTLFWYFSGHGMENGGMLTEDHQLLHFREVAEAVKSVRQTKLKRLLVVIDNCFSGTNIDQVIPGASLTDDEAREGAEALTRATVDGAAAALRPVGAGYSDNLYEQALVFTASTAQQTSLDGATGGVFSNAWRETLASLKATNPKATIRDMVTGATAATIRDMVTGATAATPRSSGGHHTPLHKALPAEAVLDDALFEASTRPSDTQPATPAAPASPANPSSQSNEPASPAGPGATPAPSPGSTPGTPSASRGLTVAVSTPDAAGYVMFRVTAPAATFRVGLCAGAEAACRASMKDDFVFKKEPVAVDQASGAKTFALLGAAKLEAGAAYTVLAFSASGQLEATKELTTAP